MGMTYSVILFFVSILNYIGLSSQAGRNQNGDSSDILDLTLRLGPPPSPNHRILQSPADPASHLPARSRYRSVSPLYASTLEPLQRSRSRSPCYKPPLTRTPYHEVLGYGLGQLGFIRLVPYRNSRRKFEFRRYTFPRFLSIRVRLANNVYDVMPNHELIVLSTSNGDVFAILETGGTFSGIYNSKGKKCRAKMNMRSCVITDLTREEMEEAPVGIQRKIERNFSAVYETPDTLQMNQ